MTSTPTSNPPPSPLANYYPAKLGQSMNVPPPPTLHSIHLSTNWVSEIRIGRHPARCQLISDGCLEAKKFSSRECQRAKSVSCGTFAHAVLFIWTCDLYAVISLVMEMSSTSAAAWVDGFVLPGFSPELD